MRLLLMFAVLGLWGCDCEWPRGWLDPQGDREPPACRTPFLPTESGSGERSRLPLMASPPPSLRLTELPGEIHGDEPPPAGALQRWTTPGELTRWRKRDGEGGAEVRGPDLSRHGEAIRSLVVRFRSASARSVELLAATTRGRVNRFDQMHRRVMVPILDSQRGQSVTVRFELRDLVTNNWEIDPRRSRNRSVNHVELVFAGAEPAEVTLEEIVLEPEGVEFDRPAGVARVDRESVVLSSWFVRSGVSVDLSLQVPRESPRLDLQLASLGGEGRARVSIVADEESTELARLGAGERWAPHRLDLSRWAGRRVELKLLGEEGLVFFGNPVVYEARPERSAPDVVFYMVDTLLANQLGYWGNPTEGVSPTLDRMAAEGMTFGHAVSVSPWTKPSIPTLMTGLDATTHRVGATDYTERLPDDVPTVQDRFREAGYRVGSFSASPLGSSLSGLDRGFPSAFLPSYWRASVEGGHQQPLASQLHESLLAWLDETPERPFYAYVHSLDVHEHHLALHRRRGTEPMRPYERAIRSQDDALGELLEALEARGRDVIVVLVSDHGESLGEHERRGHGTTVHHAQLHVPLIFWSPGRIVPRTLNHVVGLADVAPTLLALAGLPGLPISDGESLLPYFLGSDEPVHDAVFSSRQWYIWEPTAPPLFALTTNDRRKVISTRPGELHAFLLDEDLCEVDDVLGRLGDVEADLKARLSEVDARAAEFRRRYGAAGSSALAPEDVERLRALGYIE